MQHLLTIASEHLVHAAGAGDQFAAGFLYGIMRGYSMRKCAQLGCLAGGAVVQVVGAEMTPDSWRWVFARSVLGHSLVCFFHCLVCFCGATVHTFFQWDVSTAC